MPLIIFTNGKHKKVDYNTAAKIYQVLTGNKEPENKEQEDFCMRVKEVRFDNKGTNERPWEVWQKGKK